MKYLIILNDPPYGTERSYNGIRLATALKKNDANADIRVFLIGDAVSCAIAGQKTPDGYYNLERMIRGLLVKKASIACCGSCMDARGIEELSLISGVARGTMGLLAEWTAEATKVLTF